MEEETVVATETEQVAAPVVETQVETSDADLQAGFNAVNGIEPPKPEPEPEVKLIAGYTEDQIKEAFATIDSLKQRESKVFGSLGSMKQTLDSIRTQQQAPAVKVTPDSFKRLSKEFPEIAQMLAEDLGESFSGSAPVFDDTKIDERIQTSNKAIESKLLTIQHRDWKTVTQSDDFRGWKDSLPPATKAELESSWDAEFLGEKISEFKEWKAKASQSKQVNRQRLEAAIPPKSGNASGKPALSETDAFAAAFNKARGR